MDQTSKIKEMIIPVLNELSIKLYECNWRQEGSARVLEVAIMHEDGSMDIDTCASVSEQLSLVLDEQDVIASEYFLEVCSPGAERILRTHEEIVNAIGEYIYVKLKNPASGIDEVKGTLVSVEEDSIHIDYLAKAVKKKITIEEENIALIRLSVKI